MTNGREHAGEAGWLVTPRGIAAVSAAVALAYALAGPVRYVAQLAGAVERASAGAERLAASTRRQEERIEALEASVARLEGAAQRTGCAGSAAHPPP